MRRRVFLHALGGAVALWPRAAHADLGEPFGLPTAAATEGPLWKHWRELQSQMQSEQRVIAECRAKPDACASPGELRFKAIVKEGNQHEGISRIGRINRAANLAISAVKPGVQTTWTSPFDALAAGFGDCKQFAVVKYAALEHAGFAPKDLRFVIVEIKAIQNWRHVVVAVRNAADWLILDNRSLAIVESSELLEYYEPIFVLDHQGVRQFIRHYSPKIAGRPLNVPAR